MRWGSLAAIAYTLAFAPACGDDDDNNGDDGGNNGGASGRGGGDAGDAGDAGDGVPLSALPGQIAAVFCELIEGCFGAFYTVIPQPDCATNLENEFVNGDYSVFEAAVAAGRIEYDAAAVPACLDALRALECDVLTERNLEVCEDAIRGTVAPGEACSVDAECEGGAFCDLEVICPGVCATPRALDETCASDSECESGLNCDGARCIQRATAGEPCEGPNGRACQVGLACRGATDTASGTCATATALVTRAEGEACDPTSLDLCEPGLSCVFEGLVDLMASYECRQKSESGGPCRLGFPEPCPDGEYCDDPLPLDDEAGTCTRLPVAGETCLSTDNRSLRCDIELVCAGDVCATRKANGGACDDPVECYSDQCTDGRCEGPESCIE